MKPEDIQEGQTYYGTWKYSYRTVDLITLDGQFLSWHTPLPVPGRGLFGRAHRGRCQVKTFARSAIRLEDDIS
jgi:hypothetical protein